MSNLARRALTAFILGSVAITAIWFSAYGLLVFALLVSVLGYLEFLGITGMKYTLLKVINVAFGIGWWVLITLDMVTDDRFAPLILLLAVLQLPVNGIILLYYKDEELPMVTLGKLIMGFAYCFVPVLFFFLLAFPSSPPINLLVDGVSIFPEWDYNPRMPLGTLFVIWASDTFAYFGGRYLGKRKLFERISPKKTWEGTLFGSAGSILFAIALHFFWPMEWNWLVVGVLVSVFSPWGDLVESLMKRSLDIKDSGSLLPGHGGVLDRFDGIYVAAPVLWVYLMVMGML